MTDSTEDHTEEIFNKLHLKEENGTMNVSVLAQVIIKNYPSKINRNF